MKTPSHLLCLTLLLTHVSAEDSKRTANTVILDETGVKNLRIQTVEVEESSFEETLFALGHLETLPSHSAVLSSRIPGRVVELPSHVGDTVTQGAVLARIESRLPGDPPPIIPLLAPLSGVITTSAMRLGQPVEPENALLEITDLRQVYAIARVPEHQAGMMKPGTKAHIRIAAVPEEQLQGELLRFGTSADEKSGTLDAVFRLQNEKLLFRPGMRAEFSIVLSQRQGITSIPRAALQGDAAQRFVYVKDFELPHAFVKCPVVIGKVNDRYAEVISGLLPGDEVVTQGSYSLAFAGAGSISLKDALDAAHGHEHNADGSEKSGSSAEPEAAHAHPHDEHLTTRWPLISYALNALLLALLIFRKKGVAA